jgi:hypothetical protein
LVPGRKFFKENIAVLLLRTYVHTYAFFVR